MYFFFLNESKPPEIDLFPRTTALPCAAGIVPVIVEVASMLYEPVPALSASAALEITTGLADSAPPVAVNVPPPEIVSEPLFVNVPAVCVNDDPAVSATTAAADVVQVPLFVSSVPWSWWTSVLVIDTVPVALFVTGTRR